MLGVDPPSWKPILTWYHGAHRRSKVIYDCIVKTLQETVESGVLGNDISLDNLITDSEKRRIESDLDIKPTIAFFGMVNSGKSSLANELLGGFTWLPTASDLCTMRLVRLNYRSKLCRKKIPFEGEEGKGERILDSRVPTKVDICLSKEERQDVKNLEVEMEFGIPNVTLHPGLQFLDFPGWGASEQMNQTVEKAIKRLASTNLLPICVLDGNLQINSAVSQ